MAAIVFPTVAQAAAQTPLNTFSPTSTPLFNTSNSFTYVYNTTLGVWEGSAGGGGGGGGTVTGVTGTLPITVATGTTTPLIGINAATTAATGSIQLATAAENAAGTDATKAVTPAFSVPKDASGMTGAALMPGGTDAQRAAIATPSGGMFRYNTDLSPDSMEFYDAGQSAWVALATLPQLQGVALDAYSNFSAAGGGFTDIPPSPGSIVRNTVAVPAGYTNFIIFSGVAFTFNYNTTTGAPSVTNYITQNNTGYGTYLGYQAVVPPYGSDGGLIQLSTSVFVAGTSAVGVSNTFRQVVTKNQPFGPIIPNDSSLVVLAWTI